MSESWKAGCAVVDITPPIGIDLAGYVAREQGATGVHDRLFARALVLENGISRVGLITCDLIGVDAADVRYVREKIREQTGIPSTSIMIAASHNHSGPSTLHTMGIGERDEEWMADLLEKLIDCTKKATRSLEPVTIREATGIADIGVNRRGKIPEGEITPLPDPDGPVDREVAVVCIDRLKTKKPWVVLLNCGCHATVLGADNRRVSADFVGVATRAIERALGDGTVALFTNGGGGNVNPVQMGSYNEATFLGERLGDTVVNLVRRPGKVSNGGLEVSVRTVELPFASVPSVESAKGLVEKYTRDAETAAAGSLARKIAEAYVSWSGKLERMALEGIVPAKITIEVQRMRLGDVNLVAVPGEVFAETAMAVKKEGKRRTILVGYANGNVGYLPPREEISKGGYEVLEAHKYYGCPAHFAPEAEEQIRAVAIALSD